MTRKMMLIAGVAGLALTAPVVAKPEKGGGNDGDRGQQSQQQAPQQQRAERSQRAERQQARQERPQQMQRMERREARQDRPQRIERQEMRRAERSQRAERGQRLERAQRIERQEMRRAERPQRIERAQRIERRQEARQAQPRFERQEIRRAERQQQRQRIERGNDRREARIERRQENRVERVEQQIERRAQFRDNRQERREARFENRQENRQAFREMKGDKRAFRQQFAQRLQGPLASQFVSREMRPMRSFDYDDRRVVSVGDRFNLAAQTTFVPTFYRDDYYDTPQYYYRYDDDLGYLYRVNRSNDFVNALIPLFGGYGVGDPWPMTYQSSYVPYGYQSLYYDTPDHYYRYDGYGIYQIDAQTQLISALVALISGNGFGVGQVLPQSNYGVYNVPLEYRSSYYDTDDSWYRYGDGYIYQVDPVSYRVEERYPIYASYDNYLVGQPWPVAYPDYNVPYGYRDLYYDTPQYNYRYANGAIYQVDPTSQLITAIVSLLSGQNFAVGQPLPAGYDVYNVPFAYRNRYADTADDWYRYNDGYVYQVDADTGLIEDAYPVYA